MEVGQLIAQARTARERAYAPYSRFKVGAALLCRSGRVFTGCNVENALLDLGICAERAALFKAVSEGETEFEAIAVVTEPGVSPCGACRQVLAEFGLDIRVYSADLEGNVSERTVGELLPDAFGPQHLSP
jgi:cytidine deaminase